MAKKSVIARSQKKPKYSSRIVSCFREMASKGEIPGVKKASW